MTTITVEYVKRNVKEQLAIMLGRNYECGFPTDHAFMAILPAFSENKKPRELLREWHDKAIELVDAWDVRMIGKLIELFPMVIPKYLHGRPFRCEYNDRLEWVLIWEDAHARSTRD